MHFFFKNSVCKGTLKRILLFKQLLTLIMRLIKKNHKKHAKKPKTEKTKQTKQRKPPTKTAFNCLVIKMTYTQHLPMG